MDRRRTGAGKSTVARPLASRFNAVVYGGDRVKPGWEPRRTQRDHPHLFDACHLPRAEGDTLPNDRPVLVDWFGLALGTCAHC